MQPGTPGETAQQQGLRDPAVPRAARGPALHRQGLRPSRVPHLHWLLLAPVIVLSLLVLPAALRQVGVVGQPAQQGRDHGAGVHLLL